MQRGILGGTFDPPHLAHLVAGEGAYRQLHLDVVTFMPAGAPWQKADRRVSAAEHRWAMTKLAVADADYFEPDDREVHRAGWTYTIDTVAAFPDDDKITLILGADAARGLPTWHRFEEVLARARIAVMPRPGVERGAVDAVGDVIWLDLPMLDVSGSLIRERTAAGLGVRFLVPDPVWAYFVEHDLYGT